jgi:hypothetical protein
MNNDRKIRDSGAPDSGAPVGSTDESIGRPGPWREGRYERKGERVDQSVNQPGETPAEPHDTMGTQTPPATGRANKPKAPPAQDEKPVTLKDYE